MREILCEIFDVTDDELNCVLESVKTQIKDLWFTPKVESTLKAILNLWSVDKMMKEFDIPRNTTHTRRSMLGYDVLRELLAGGAISVKECCCD